MHQNVYCITVKINNFLTNFSHWQVELFQTQISNENIFLEDPDFGLKSFTIC